MGMLFGRPTAAPINLRDLYFNAPAPATIKSRRPSIGERAADALGKVGVSQRQANRWGEKLASAVEALTPVGNVTQGFQAGQDLRNGNLLSGGLGAALAMLPGVPKGGKFAGEIRSALPGNDTGDGLDTIKSLTEFLTDHRPIHEMYETGDMLSHHGEIGSVISATKDAVVLDLPSGQRIVPRRDPHLAVAPYKKW